MIVEVVLLAIAVGLVIVNVVLAYRFERLR